MRDSSDLEQARTFYELLLVEADTLDAAIRAIGVTTRGTSPQTTESRLLRRDLHEVRRCLDNLRVKFPELGHDAVQ